MYSKFKVTCKTCGCSMEFRPADHPPVSPIVCQNCAQALPDNAHTALSRAMAAIRQLPYVTEEDGWVEPETGFKFEVAILPSPLSDDDL